MILVSLFLQKVVLVVPIVRDADRKNFAEIEANIGELAKKARDNKLALSDMSGGSFHYY